MQKIISLIHFKERCVSKKLNKANQQITKQINISANELSDCLYMLNKLKQRVIKIFLKFIDLSICQ